MYRYIKQLYCLIYILGFCLIGQDLGEVTIYNTTNSDLAYNQINCIEFDNENRIWIGTQNGLSIFNEELSNWDNIFEASTNSSTPWSSLPSNIITTLNWNDFSDQPMMLIGTNSGITEVWWENEQFGENGQSGYWSSNFGDECDPNNGIIRSIFQNNNEQIWIGSTDGLCVKGLGENEDWVLQNTSTGFYSNNITSISKNLNNEILAIGTINGGLITHNNQFNIYYSSNSDILDNTVFDAVFDLNNNIIICTPQAGLGVLTTNGSWVWFNTINSSLPNNSLKNVVVDNNNNLWITTLENGLIHYKNNVFYHYTVENSNLPDNKINCLKFGPNNHLWLGTETAGLVKINNPTTYINQNQKSYANVYPSIFNSFINIELRVLSNVSIFNQNGQIINNYPNINGNNIISMTEYIPGIYFIKIQI